MYKEHIDAYVAGWNTGDLEGLDAVISEQTIRKGPAALESDAHNLSELKDVINKFREAYPDAHVHIEEFFEQGDRTFARWTFTGTNTGPGDFPPTGNSVKVEGTSFSRFEGGKLAEELVYFDALGMMTQLGLVELPQS